MSSLVSDTGIVLGLGCAADRWGAWRRIPLTLYVYDKVGAEWSKENC